jgi:hypothetical protein
MRWAGYVAYGEEEECIQDFHKKARKKGTTKKIQKWIRGQDVVAWTKLI